MAITRTLTQSVQRNDPSISLISHITPFTEFTDIATTSPPKLSSLANHHSAKQKVAGRVAKETEPEGEETENKPKAIITPENKKKRTQINHSTLILCTSTPQNPKNTPISHYSSVILPQPHKQPKTGAIPSFVIT